MLFREYIFCQLSILLFPLLSLQAGQAPSLPTLHVTSQQTANILPVATYASPVSNLEFEPRIDLQSRNMAEAQGDVSIRGGIFENTGFRIGSATLLDPQTGHYSSELPIAPEMLERPEVLTGAENALYGFNSTAGTISYTWSQVQDAGSLSLGGGDHGLNFQRLHQGLTGEFAPDSPWTWGVEVESSRSESDGTIRFGDHDFSRSTGRVQILGPHSQTDLFAGYQSKFFGWPELYAAPFGSNETENLKTRLFMANHQQDYGDQSHWEATAYTRRHSDHYVFNRSAPNNAFNHETQVHSLGLSGTHAFNASTAMLYAAQFTADNIESTTLENSFTTRQYAKFSIWPQYQWELNQKDRLKFRAGASFDDTNRDRSEVSALFDLRWVRNEANGDLTRVHLSFAESTQVAGYTAIGGPAAGLFASDPTLSRETSQNLEIGLLADRQNWSFHATLFHRWDDGLVDWTYNSALPNARAARNVDINTLGAEFIVTRRWSDFEAIAAYTFLNKDEDYRAAAVDASFYALNYAKHRATLGILWRPIEWLEIRIDNEWRENEANALRNSKDRALFTHFGLSLYPSQIEGLELFFAIDNAWDDDFDDVPGTPGRGDQYSAGATLRW